MKQETAQHTPGPWQIDTGIDGAAIHNGVTIASVPIDAAAWEANARLIAAAPLLLEALKDAEKALASYATTRVGVHHSALERARAAIAAAQQ